LEPTKTRQLALLRRFNMICRLLVYQGKGLAAPYFDEVHDPELPLWETVLDLPKGSLALRRFTTSPFIDLRDDDVLAYLLSEQGQKTMTTFTQVQGWLDTPESLYLEVLSQRNIRADQVLLLTKKPRLRRMMESLGTIVRDPSTGPRGLQLGVFRIVLIDAHQLGHSESGRYTMVLEEFNLSKPRTIVIRDATLQTIVLALIS